MRRVYAVFLFVCLSFAATPAFATREKLQGWCEQGGTAVTVPGTTGSGSQRFQQSYRSCTVTVYDASTSTPATVYADSSGTPKANPFTADTTGYWFFYGDGGRYDVRFSGGGMSTAFTTGDYRVPNESINVDDYGAVPDCSTDNTAALTRAIAAIAVIPSASKRIIMPGSCYAISSTLAISTLNGIDMFGSGQGDYTGATTYGTKIKWIGASGGTMMSITDTSWSSFHDFQLDGNSLAGVGLDIRTSATNQSTQSNRFNGLSIVNITGTPGRSISLGGFGAAGDINGNEFYKCVLINGVIGVYQAGGQTLQNPFVGTIVFSMTNYGFYFDDGSVDLYRGLIINGGNNVVADVYVDAKVAWFFSDGMVHEVNTGNPVIRRGYYFPLGVARPFTTSLRNLRMKWDLVGGYPFDYDQTGRLTLDSVNITSDSGSGTGTLPIRNTFGGGDVHLSVKNSDIAVNLFTWVLGSNIAGEFDATPVSGGFWGLGYSPAPATNFATSRNSIMVSDPLPTLILRDSDAGSGERIYQIRHSGDNFAIQACDDLGTTCTDAIQIRRTGATVNDVFIPSTVGKFQTNATLVTSVTTFAALPASPSNGMVVTCTDCAATNPCTGGGTGRIALYVNGAWKCQ